MRLDAVIRKTQIETRPYQVRIVSKTFKMLTGQYRDGAGNLQDNIKSVMIESPTGSGKTIMGLLALKYLQTHVPDLHIGWVAHRRNLLDQAAREN